MKSFARFLALAFLAAVLPLSCAPIQNANAILIFNPTADTYIDTYYPDSTYGSSQTINVEGGVYKQRSLLRFDLTSIPAGSTITQATLRLYVWGYGAVAGTVTAYRATEDWAEDQATWNKRLNPSTGWTGTSPIGGGGTWTDEGAATVAAQSGGDWMSWTVTDIVKAWIEGGKDNSGFVIKVTDDTNTNCWLMFASAENSNKEYYPVLEILGPPEPSRPSNPYHYVGGEVFSANKLAVLAPYLALFSIVAVATVVVKRKLT